MVSADTETHSRTYSCTLGYTHRHAHTISYITYRSSCLLAASLCHVCKQQTTTTLTYAQIHCTYSFKRMARKSVITFYMLTWWWFNELPSQLQLQLKGGGEEMNWWCKDEMREKEAAMRQSSVRMPWLVRYVARYVCGSIRKESFSTSWPAAPYTPLVPRREGWWRPQLTGIKNKQWGQFSLNVVSITVGLSSPPFLALFLCAFVFLFHHYFLPPSQRLLCFFLTSPTFFTFFLAHQESFTDCSCKLT